MKKITIKKVKNKPETFEKSALKSKKFLMVLVTQGILTLFVMTSLLMGLTSASMTPVLVTAVAGLVFIGAGYIGGVAWLDKWVRVAHINTGSEEIPE